MSNLKKLYKSGVNIMEYFRSQKGNDDNTLDAILASYDMQAGSYVAALRDDTLKDRFHVGGEKKEMTHRDYLNLFTSELVNEINKYEYGTILEAGVGEATTFSYLIKKLNNQSCVAKGFDISPSRIKVAQQFVKDNQLQNADLFVAGLENIPFADNSFDIVYTVHALEPNSGNEKALVEELYRVAKKYLILVEPSYELGNDETKANIERHKYIKNLKATIEELGYKVLRYELSSVGTYTNQPAIVVIEKLNTDSDSSVDYCCCECHSKLEFVDGHYFCEACSLVYPILSDVAILDSDRAIFFSKYKD